MRSVNSEADYGAVSKFVTDSRRSFRLISVFQKGKVLERSS